jgi:hypothetical protein
MRQDTVHPKTDTSRDQQAISAGKKKSVTFGDSCTEEKKNSETNDKYFDEKNLRKY